LREILLIELQGGKTTICCVYGFGSGAGQTRKLYDRRKKGEEAGNGEQGVGNREYGTREQRTENREQGTEN
jgi:hypothetical protein